MIHRLVFLASLVLVLGACAAAAPTTTPQPTTLSVSAAASLSEAFPEIAKQFEAQHPGVKVEFNFAGSQQLAEQLAQGAPSDVFASANKKQMDAAVKSGRVNSQAPVDFLQNRLVVVVPKQQKVAIGLKLVLGAKEVPVGQYALDFLDKADKSGTYGPDFKSKVLANVVSYEQDVKAVLTKVGLGEADAGVVYTTDASSAPDSVTSLPIPDDLNVVAVYPIAPIANSAHADLAQAFVAFVRSPQGQAVLTKFGFQPIAP
jgi:molybdate transport system substrate-binding protein